MSNNEEQQNSETISKEYPKSSDYQFFFKPLQTHPERELIKKIIFEYNQNPNIFDSWSGIIVLGDGPKGLRYDESQKIIPYSYVGPSNLFPLYDKTRRRRSSQKSNQHFSTINNTSRNIRGQNFLSNFNSNYNFNNSNNINISRISTEKVLTPNKRYGTQRSNKNLFRGSTLAKLKGGINNSSTRYTNRVSMKETENPVMTSIDDKHLQEHFDRIKNRIKNKNVFSEEKRSIKSINNHLYESEHLTDNNKDNNNIEKDNNELDKDNKLFPTIIDDRLKFQEKVIERFKKNNLLEKKIFRFLGKRSHKNLGSDLLPKRSEDFVNLRQTQKKVLTRYIEKEDEDENNYNFNTNLWMTKLRNPEENGKYEKIGTRNIGTNSIPRYVNFNLNRKKEYFFKHNRHNINNTENIKCENNNYNKTNNHSFNQFISSKSPKLEQEKSQVNNHITLMKSLEITGKDLLDTERKREIGYKGTKFLYKLNQLDIIKHKEEKEKKIKIANSNKEKLKYSSLCNNNENPDELFKEKIFVETYEDELEKEKRTIDFRKKYYQILKKNKTVENE